MASLIGSLFQILPLASSAKNLLVPRGKTYIGDVVIDATLNEVINYKSTITEHPIESKEAISDHIFKSPLKLKIEGYITDSPMRIMGLLETPLQKNSLSSLTNNLKEALPFYATEKPSSQAYFALQSIYKGRELITVVSKLETFPDMVLERLQFINNEETGGRLSFNADLKQIVYARINNIISVSSKNVPLAQLTSPKIDRGIIPNQAEPLKSFGASAIDYIGSFF